MSLSYRLQKLMPYALLLETRMQCRVLQIAGAYALLVRDVDAL